jgi:hypothetical protein
MARGLSRFVIRPGPEKKRPAEVKVPTGPCVRRIGGRPVIVLCRECKPSGVCMQEKKS